MQYEVYEGDPIDLAGVETEEDVEFTLLNTDGNGKEEKATAKSHKHTCGKVPPGKDHYVISWKYKLPAQEELLSGKDTFRVWPKHLKLAVQLKEGAKGSVEGFTFSLAQGEKTEKPTVTGGAWTGPLEKKAYQLEVVSPWKLEEKIASTEEAASYTLKVSQLPWTAKIISHADGRAEATPWKQYVNSPLQDGTENGNIMRVEVAPHDRTLGLKDQKLSVCVTFKATNSKRTTPRPALILNGAEQTSTDPGAAPGTADLVYKAQLALPANGGSCVFHVQLGYAGGDSCHIQVGFDDGTGDDELWVCNWRRLESEFVVPHSDLRQGWDEIVNNDDVAPRPHATFKAALKRILDPLFIELNFPDAFCAVYTAANINTLLSARGGVDTFIMPGAYVHPRLTADKNCTFLPPTDLDALRDLVLHNAPADPRRFMLVWTDMLPKTLSDDDANVAAATPGEYVAVFEAKDTPVEHSTAKGQLTALRNPVCTSAADLWGVEKVYWRITGFRKQGDTEWLEKEVIWKEDEPGQSELNSLWNYWEEPTEVLPTTEAEASKWVDFVSSQKFKIKLPNTDPNDPGQYLDWNGYEHRIVVTVGLRHFQMGANANAVQGKIRMTPCMGLGTADGVARTLCHEMGHNLGHAYIENKGEATDKRGRLPRHQIPGIPFDAFIPAGFFYAGRGHKGAHCAHGLKAAGKNLGARSFAPADFQLDTNCVLFGQGDQTKTVQFNYCPECTRYIRASDALDITTNWKA
ncbi:hypothetical protein BHS09_37300 [Myxococcus xanthus]|uniref:Uncharacterized protein n=1 Tax=Myxococcus xanthus TaxID=34 RepID=A0AAE6G777_MYXXA|nr:hypothetical protein [Myxococcus xanthus]QDE72176.1 hypothetical protein BHS09_37300 [Myxococcus xanthus]QDE79458.1 hypothetical protein BHS08_37325 [Myxococcus xanthus]